jgi:hypothetical protein
MLKDFELIATYTECRHHSYSIHHSRRTGTLDTATFNKGFLLSVTLHHARNVDVLFCTNEKNLSHQVCLYFKNEKD